MRTNKIIYAFAALSLFVNIAFAADPPAKNGKEIFTSRCASCHNVNKVLTGPALAGVDQRYSIDWIINFVHSSQTMVKKGDKAALAVYEKFNKIPMPDHTDLTDENIKSIVEYIKTESKNSNSEKAPFAKPTPKKANYVPLSIRKDAWAFISITVAIACLIGTLLFAAKVNSMKREHELKRRVKSI